MLPSYHLTTLTMATMDMVEDLFRKISPEGRNLEQIQTQGGHHPPMTGLVNEEEEGVRSRKRVEKNQKESRGGQSGW